MPIVLTISLGRPYEVNIKCNLKVYSLELTKYILKNNEKFYPVLLVSSLTELNKNM